MRRKIKIYVFINNLVTLLRQNMYRILFNEKEKLKKIGSLGRFVYVQNGVIKQTRKYIKKTFLNHLFIYLCKY